MINIFNVRFIKNVVGRFMQGEIYNQVSKIPTNLINLGHKFTTRYDYEYLLMLRNFHFGANTEILEKNIQLLIG